MQPRQPHAYSARTRSHGRRRAPRLAAAQTHCHRVPPGSHSPGADAAEGPTGAALPQCSTAGSNQRGGPGPGGSVAVSAKTGGHARGCGVGEGWGRRRRFGSLLSLPGPGPPVQHALCVKSVRSRSAPRAPAFSGVNDPPAAARRRRKKVPCQRIIPLLPLRSARPKSAPGIIPLLCGRLPAAGRRGGRRRVAIRVRRDRWAGLVGGPRTARRPPAEKVGRRRGDSRGERVVAEVLRHPRSSSAAHHREASAAVGGPGRPGR